LDEPFEANETKLANGCARFSQRSALVISGLSTACALGAHSGLPTAFRSASCGVERFPTAVSHVVFSFFGPQHLVRSSAVPFLLVLTCFSGAMAEKSSTRYFFIKWCPRADECSDQSWKRAAVWDHTPDGCRDRLVDHLVTSGHHEMDEDDAIELARMTDVQPGEQEAAIDAERGRRQCSPDDSAP
jgi:hypothetical protein